MPLEESPVKIRALSQPLLGVTGTHNEMYKGFDKA